MSGAFTPAHASERAWLGYPEPQRVSNRGRAESGEA
jgi:hypothetical protein